MTENESVQTESPDVSSETPSVEFDVDKETGLDKVRSYAKSLKADLDTYKGTHEFVAQTFGDTEVAKQAGQLFNTFANENFDPKVFLDEITKVSPTRAQALVDNLSSAQAEALAQERVKQLFGGDVSKEEAELFQKWKNSGYMVTDTEDIPEAFKYDAEGNPLSDEQVEHYRKQFEMLKDMQERLKEQVDSKEKTRTEQLEAQKMTQLEESISSYDSDRLKVVNSDFEKYGLNPLPTDTPERVQEKNFVKEFVLGGIVRAFSTKPELMNDYATAIEHIKKAEPTLARRYEPRIEKGILDILRHPTVSKMLSSLIPDTPEPARPEISNSGSPAESRQPPRSGDISELVRDVFARGLIK